MVMLKVLNVVMLLRGAAAARVAVGGAGLDPEDDSDPLDDADASSTNHTFEDCHCAFTSGRKPNCCHAKGIQIMGTGKQCGRKDDMLCGGENPVCCTSKLAGSVCCPAGSTCSTSCRGDGGSNGRDGGLCRCQPPPEKNIAQDYMKFPVLQMFAHLAQAGYCGPDFYSPFWFNLSKWECIDDCAPAGLRLKKGSIRRITRADGDTHNGTFAYVGVFQDAGNGKQQGEYAPKDGDCVVVFAGSISAQNWKRNFQFVRKKSGDVLESLEVNDKRVSFHLGHQHIWDRLSADETEGGVIYELNKAGCGPGSDRSVFPTGQSLGAGVATIALMDLNNRGFKAGLTYVFNSPRVGNKHTMKLYREAFGRPVSLFRMNHGKDPISRLGPYASGYRHVGAEVYFPRNWDDKKLDYVVCLDEEDKACGKRYSMVRTFAGGDDHCENPLIKKENEGNICALPDFCNDPENPMPK
jgi:hypothetical protein